MRDIFRISGGTWPATRLCDMLGRVGNCAETVRNLRSSSAAAKRRGCLWETIEFPGEPDRLNEIKAKYKRSKRNNKNCDGWGIYMTLRYTTNCTLNSNSNMHSGISGKGEQRLKVAEYQVIQVKIRISDTSNKIHTTKTTTVSKSTDCPLKCYIIFPIINFHSFLLNSSPNLISLGTMRPGQRLTPSTTNNKHN
jgi:hypothetical protein